MKRFLTITLLTLTTLPVFGENAIDRYYTAPYHREIGYTEATVWGDRLYLSGIVGWGETMEEQVRVAYERIEAALNTYGLTFSDVLKENLYTTDLDAVKALIPLRKTFYKDEFPAGTWVEVRRLFNPEFQVEIELVVRIPEGHVLPRPETLLPAPASGTEG